MVRFLYLLYFLCFPYLLLIPPTPLFLRMYGNDWTYERISWMYGNNWT